MIKLGVVMDPIETVHFSKDSTVALLFEAAKRGWLIYYMQQKNLQLRGGKVFAEACWLTLFENQQPWFAKSNKSVVALTDLDCILMRKDPPVDMAYVYATQLLEIAEKQGAKIYNRPSALRDFNEKILANWFPDCCPPTLVSADCSAIKAFLKEQGEIILKPLDGMGGQGIFHIQQCALNINVILEMLTARGERLIVAQRYLPEIQAGDKRVLMVDGQPMEYALARIPALGETRGNLAAGGKGVVVPLSKRDHFICAQIGPFLKENGLLFVGVDIIGDYLTEINITSPTCIRELEKATSLKISEAFLDVLEREIMLSLRATK
jgi:glutathione synthase